MISPSAKHFVPSYLSLPRSHRDFLLLQFQFAVIPPTSPRIFFRYCLIFSKWFSDGDRPAAAQILLENKLTESNVLFDEIKVRFAFLLANVLFPSNFTFTVYFLFLDVSLVDLPESHQNQTNEQTKTKQYKDMLISHFLFVWYLHLVTLATAFSLFISPAKWKKNLKP